MVNLTVTSVVQKYRSSDYLRQGFDLRLPANESGWSSKFPPNQHSLAQDKKRPGTKTWRSHGGPVELQLGYGIDYSNQLSGWHFISYFAKTKPSADMKVGLKDKTERANHDYRRSGYCNKYINVGTRATGVKVKTHRIGLCEEKTPGELFSWFIETVFLVSWHDSEDSDPPTLL